MRSKTVLGLLKNTMLFYYIDNKGNPSGLSFFDGVAHGKFSKQIRHLEAGGGFK